MFDLLVNASCNLFLHTVNLNRKRLAKHFPPTLKTGFSQEETSNAAFLLLTAVLTPIISFRVAVAVFSSNTGM